MIFLFVIGSLLYFESNLVMYFYIKYGLKVLKSKLVVLISLFISLVFVDFVIVVLLLRIIFLIEFCWLFFLKVVLFFFNILYWLYNVLKILSKIFLRIELLILGLFKRLISNWNGFNIFNCCVFLDLFVFFLLIDLWLWNSFFIVLIISGFEYKLKKVIVGFLWFVLLL